ncbi:hypothetical protein [Nonomuraea dietziae]|uniref:hypothetical protein n=1 Tax=Nonomuraea dietziae TaxID=65515 RepID=UPI003437EDCC
MGGGVRELVTTLLDVLGLLMVAAGITALLLPWTGWGALAAGGLVVLGGSWWGARQAQPTVDRTGEHL